MLKLATVFSGIGAIESALNYLNYNYMPVFACDNGERALSVPYEAVDKMILKKSDEEIKSIINELYRKTGKQNLVKETYFANYDIDEREKENHIIIENLLEGNRAAVENRRRGQAKWRRALFDSMPACIITKVTEDRILEACHIKPHNIATDEEMYDIHNGLVMTPTYHKLFDLGFISFKDDGSILISPFLSNMNKQRLGLVDGRQYKVPKECLKYLSYHRNYVYNQIPELDV